METATPIKLPGSSEISNQAQLARAVGMSRASISRLFSGHRNPSIHAAKKIADSLKISVDELLNFLKK